MRVIVKVFDVPFKAEANLVEFLERQPKPPEVGIFWKRLRSKSDEHGSVVELELRESTGGSASAWAHQRVEWVDAPVLRGLLDALGIFPAKPPEDEDEPGARIDDIMGMIAPEVLKANMDPSSARWMLTHLAKDTTKLPKSARQRRALDLLVEQIRHSDDELMKIKEVVRRRLKDGK